MLTKCFKRKVVEMKKDIPKEYGDPEYLLKASPSELFRIFNNLIGILFMKYLWINIVIILIVLAIIFS